MLWVLKEPSQWDGSFEHPKHMFKLLDKKIIKLKRKFIKNPYLDLWLTQRTNWLRDDLTHFRVMGPIFYQMALC